MNSWDVDNPYRQKMSIWITVHVDKHLNMDSIEVDSARSTEEDDD
jgi:hypothetical protein